MTGAAASQLKDGVLTVSLWAGMAGIGPDEWRVSVPVAGHRPVADAVATN